MDDRPAPRLDDLVSLWHEHAPDEDHGAFHLSLSREWEPIEPREKHPAMVGRQVFAFASAYLLSGETRHLRQARRGVEYLLEYGWDAEYGGWFDALTRDGDPAETTKSVPNQLYTNAGLTRYYHVTGDERALDAVEASLDIRRTHGHDPEYGGYYQQLGRDLSVTDAGKNKHAHYGYVGSQTLDMALATGDDEWVDFARELCDLSIERHMEDGWLYGFGSEFDRQWRRTPNVVDGDEVVSVGAALTGALAFLRLHRQTGEDRYREVGERLAANVNRHGFDERGCFWDWLVEDTLVPATGATVSWWIQLYGIFLQFHLYELTGDASHLERLRAAERFYRAHFLDDAHGGVVRAVSAEGTVENGQKAGPFITAYHEVEHVVLRTLYRRLYVEDEPVTVHYRLDGGGTHHVCPVDDRRVAVSGVTVDGESWSRFDADARTVTLPSRSDLAVSVTLDPP